MLGCDCDYTSLMNFERIKDPPKGQEVERLKNLNLSAMATAGDIEVMSEFDHTEEDSIDPEVWAQILHRVQIAIARTAVVVPEVCRLLINCASVNEHWVRWGSYLNDLLIGYMRNWKVMSDAIRNGPDDRLFTATEKKETGLTYAFQAFEVVHLVLNSKGVGLPSKDNKKGDDEDGNGRESQGDSGKGGSNPPPGDGLPSKDNKKGDDEDGNGGESQGDSGKGGSNPPPDTKKEGNDDSQGGDGHDTGKVSLDIGELHEFPLSLRGRPHFPISGTGLLELLMPEKSIDVVRKGFLPGTTSTSKYELSGQRLVEVFSIHTNSSFIKKISIYDDRCGKIMYMSRDVDIANFFRKRDLWLSSHTGRDSLDYMDKLVISGPDRAMSAFPRFVIEVDVDDKDGVFNLCWNWADGTVINKPMVQSIFTSRGDIHLTTAVMSNALQGSIEFSLLLPEVFWYGVLDVVVEGELVLKIDNFPVGCSIFQSDSGDAYLTPTGKFTHIAERSLDMTPKEMYAQLTKGPKRTDMIVMKVPLTRDLLVLPVGCSINLTGLLRVGVATVVTINHSMKVNDRSGWSKVPVDSFSMFGDDAAISHGAIRIETISPF